MSKSQFNTIVAFAKPILIILEEKSVVTQSN